MLQTKIKENSNGMAAPIILLIVVIVAAVGFGGWYVYQQQSEETAPSIEEVAQDAVFDPFSTDGLAFVATFSTTVDGQQQTGTMESDGKGNFQVTGAFDGQEGRFITTQDYIYNCMNDECFRLPRTDNQQNETVDVDDFTVEQDDIERYQNNANYEGRQDCPAGTCHVWTVSEEGGTTRIYIDVDSRRISQIVANHDGFESTVTYEYRDVTIDIPTNYREMPGLPQ